MSVILKCFFGPRLFRIHQKDESPGKLYEQNIMENIGDSIIKWFKFCWGLTYWTSPVVLTVLYRRGTFTLQGLASWTSYATGLGIILVFAIFVRGIGRITNSEYTKFLKVLMKGQTSWTADNKRDLSLYDFDFKGWPVDFAVEEITKSDESKARVQISPTTSRGNVNGFKALPCYILSYICAHTFGRRMVYPGATALIQTLMSQMLILGRAKLIEEKRGLRSKLKTEDGNHIDTMFVDRRNNPMFPNGNVLVICSEGNSGFYEVGCMCTPLDAGYSVLGWNHPGFWGSSGVPFPGQEQNAIDAVMQYTIHKLGFQPYDVILFAWSIGGYPATWAAMNYPDIRCVVLDATFDSLLPLAIARMPRSWRDLVSLTVKKYMDLNNAEQLCKYPGPVLLIRRSKDEMITTVDPTIVSSNRGNDLLVKLLQHRYPKIVNETTMPFLREYLGTSKTGQVLLWSRHEVDEDYCLSCFTSYASENSNSFPMQLGEDFDREKRIQFSLFLARKYLEDFDSTHCTPLPPSYFKEPWTIDV